MGLRITTAVDDPAGLAMSERLRARRSARWTGAARLHDGSSLQDRIGVQLTVALSSDLGLATAGIDRASAAVAGRISAPPWRS